MAVYERIFTIQFANSLRFWPEEQSWFEQVRKDAPLYCPLLVRELDGERVLNPVKIVLAPGSQLGSASDFARARFAQAVTLIVKICDDATKDHLVEAFRSLGRHLDKEPENENLLVLRQHIVRMFTLTRDGRLRDVVLELIENVDRPSQADFLEYFHAALRGDPVVGKRLRALPQASSFRRLSGFEESLKRGRWDTPESRQ
jgi:hypothetical protein